MRSYQHLPAEQRRLAAEIDAIFEPLLGAVNAPVTGMPPAPARSAPHAGEEVIPRHYRVVVATDWTAATVPFLVLRAFTRILPPHAPVDLVFAVPHIPTRRDLAAAALLRDSLEPGTRHAGITIESFEDACGKHACASVVPTGDPDILLRDVVTAITVLHDLARLTGDRPASGAGPVPADGPNPRLRRRLDAFLAAGQAGQADRAR